MKTGCPGCHAQAVGEPLARPETELPFYGRSTLVGAVGVLTGMVFLGSTLAALFERPALSFDFWSVVSAAETAAWRLKFAAVPTLLLSLWGGLALYRSIIRSNGRFAGAQFARAGLSISMLVTVAFVAAIGITVPERLRQQQRGIKAGEEASLYAFQAAQLQYKAKYGTYIASIDDLRKLPDPDGSIARLLAGVDPKGYQPRSELAVTLAGSSPKSKAVKLRGAALKGAEAASDTDDTPGQGLSFTNYEIRLPGQDGIVGTDDDPRMVDGLVVSPVDTTQNSGSSVTAP